MSKIEAGKCKYCGRGVCNCAQCLEIKGESDICDTACKKAYEKKKEKEAK